MPVVYSNKGTPILVDDEDWGWCRNHEWSEIRPKGRGPYFTTRTDAGTEYLHRMISGATKGLIADHINHNTLDNRRANLRVVTPSQSQMNRRVQSNSSTGLKGVFPKGDRFRSYIRVRGKQMWVGVFDTAEEAHAAYRAAARKHHGEFACDK